MIKHLDASELKSIAIGGGSLRVHGPQFEAKELRSIAVALRPGAMLIVSNSACFTAHEMRAIAIGSPNGATVLFE